MENPSSAGGAAPAVSDLRQARAVAGGSRHHRAGHRLGPGLWFRPGGLPAGGGLPHYVPACPGGHLVNGYLCGDGGGGVYRAGLADENGHPCRRGDGAGGGGVHLHRAGHRRGVGQADVGHLVGVGRAPDLGAGAAVSLRRGHRPVARL
ncbi:hypothetical protein NGUA38_04521 [Salmonella enterica]|nr:hypothetical protein NGUA38_04521 [Salmonella enterica]